MEPQGPQTYEQAIQGVLDGVLHEAILLVLPIFLMFLFKDFLAEVVGGFVWRFRSGYEEGETVNIEGEWGRITKLGFLRTTFTVYTWEEGKDEPIGGESMQILNNHLRKMKIKTPLQPVDKRLRRK